jgi:hypothetical protein
VKDFEEEEGKRERGGWMDDNDGFSENLKGKNKKKVVARGAAKKRRRRKKTLLF